MLSMKLCWCEVPNPVWRMGRWPIIQDLIGRLSAETCLQKALLPACTIYSTIVADALNADCQWLALSELPLLHGGAVNSEQC
jgi:hypothetical protein